MKATIKDAVINFAIIAACIAATIFGALLASRAHGQTCPPGVNCGDRIGGLTIVVDREPLPAPKPAKQKAVVKQKTVVKTWPKYPSRPAGRTWLYNGGPITAHHLATHPHHAHEHFDPAWLNTLTQAQLIALGSDAHDGRIREKYVVRTAPRGTVARSRVTVQSNCPGGVCPSTQSSSATTVRRGLFGRKVYRYRR